MKKYIDVNKPVLTRSGEPYRETKVDAKGHIVLESGETKPPYAIERTDVPAMEDVPVGRLLIMALDKTDDKLSPDERRKRFTLSCRIEDAMRDHVPFEMEVPDERKRIE